MARAHTPRRTQGLNTPLRSSGGSSLFGWCAAKPRLALLREGAVGLPVVGVLHADGLRLRLEFERRVEGDVQLAVEHLLRHRERERGAARESLGQLSCLGLELCGLDHTVVEAAG